MQKGKGAGGQGADFIVDIFVVCRYYIIFDFHFSVWLKAVGYFKILE